MKYVICELRPCWHAHDYISFWANKDFCWSIDDAARFAQEEIDRRPASYTQWTGRELTRFAVPYDLVRSLAIKPDPGTTDNNKGLVVRMNARNKRILRKAAYIPIA